MCTFVVGRVPFDSRLTQCLENGKSYVDIHAGASTQRAIAEIVERLLITTESASNTESITTAEII